MSAIQNVRPDAAAMRTAQTERTAAAATERNATTAPQRGADAAVADTVEISSAGRTAAAQKAPAAASTATYGQGVRGRV